MKDGYYPLVLGGDSGASLGSVQAMKKYAPKTKALWLNSTIEIPMNEATKVGDASSLQLLTGINSPVNDHKCLSASDLVVIGAKETKNFNAGNYIRGQGGLVIGRYICSYKNFDEIDKAINYDYSQQGNQYWMSLNMNAMDPAEFMSKSYKTTKTLSGDGLSKEFMI